MPELHFGTCMSPRTALNVLRHANRELQVGSVPDSWVSGLKGWNRCLVYSESEMGSWCGASGSLCLADRVARVGLTHHICLHASGMYHIHTLVVDWPLV